MRLAIEASRRSLLEAPSTEIGVYVYVLVPKQNGLSLENQGLSEIAESGWRANGTIWEKGNNVLLSEARLQGEGHEDPSEERDNLGYRGIERRRIGKYLGFRRIQEHSLQRWME